MTKTNTQIVGKGKDNEENPQEKKAMKYFNNTGIVVEGNNVIDHDKKTITEKPKGTKKKITIKEIPVDKKLVPKDSPKKAEENKESVKQADDKGKDQGVSAGSTRQVQAERRPSGELFIALLNMPIIVFLTDIRVDSSSLQYTRSK